MAEVAEPGQTQTHHGDLFQQVVQQECDLTQLDGASFSCVSCVCACGVYALNFHPLPPQPWSSCAMTSSEQPTEWRPLAQEVRCWLPVPYEPTGSVALFQEFLEV